MQEARETSQRQGRPEPAKAPLSPAKAFLLLLTLAVAAGVFLVLTRETNEPTGPRNPPEATSFALTNAEAITRFKELDSLRKRAYEQRDPSLLPQYITSESPLQSVGRREIQQLVRDNVTVDLHFRTRDLVVQNNDPDKILIRQVVDQDPHFYDEKGNEISKGETSSRLTIDWSLRQENSKWFLHNSRVIENHPINKKSKGN